MGNTEVVEQAIILELVQRQLISQSKLAQTVLNVSDLAVPGASSIAFPRSGDFTVQDKSENTSVDAQVVTYATDVLSLDKHKVIQWLLEDRANLQSKPNVVLDTIARATRGLAKQLDVDIYAQLQLASASSPDHRIALAGGTIVAADLTSALELLDVADVPDEDRYIAIHPNEKKDLMDLADFNDASQWGDDSVIKKGIIGEVFGAKVLVSNVVTSGQPAVYHREAVAFGFQSAPDYKKQYELKHLGWRHSVDSLYGVKVLNSGKMCVKLGSAS